LSGAKGGVTKPAELFPESLVWAIVSVFIVGLGCIIGLMAMMKDYGFNQLLIIAFTLLIFLLMLAVEGVFISLLFSRKSGAKEMSDTEPLKEQATKELGAAKELGTAQARVLPEPVPSVTEHTTRAFDPIYSKRKAE
jgi:uncharacterized protein YneF (UPF0154 family)